GGCTTTVALISDPDVDQRRPVLAVRRRRNRRHGRPPRPARRRILALAPLSLRVRRRSRDPHDRLEVALRWADRSDRVHVQSPCLTGVPLRPAAIRARGRTISPQTPELPA